MPNKAGQVTDDENKQTAGDPNLVGSQDTQAVQDRRAGSMTPTHEYDQMEESAGRKP
jgi:hypothetical protein